MPGLKIIEFSNVKSIDVLLKSISDVATEIVRDLVVLGNVLENSPCGQASPGISCTN
jgi:hypothetical protein